MHTYRVRGTAAPGAEEHDHMNEMIETDRLKKFDRLFGQDVDLVFNKMTYGAEGVPEEMWLPAYRFDIVLHTADVVVGKIDARIGFNESVYYGGHVGYTVKEEYRGNGFAVEAVKLLEQVFTSNGMQMIYITNSPGNEASIRVCEKLGAEFLEAAALPEDNNMRRDCGETLKYIWKLDLPRP